MTGYAVIFGIALFARLLLAVLPFEFVTPAQAAVWSWQFFAVFGLCYGSAVWLARRAKLPSPDETLRFGKRQLALPVSVGVMVGLLTIWSDIVEPAAHARGLVSLHVRGAAALPFYLYGAVLITVVFHFLPIALTAWFANRLRGPARFAVLATGVLVVTFSEDLSFFLRTPPAATLETGRHLLSVAANATEAWFTYRYGLLASLLQRGTTYVLWHIAWPLLNGIRLAF